MDKKVNAEEYTEEKESKYVWPTGLLEVTISTSFIEIKNEENSIKKTTTSQHKKPQTPANHKHTDSVHKSPPVRVSLLKLEKKKKKRKTYVF